jgi:hypothetical protein
MGFAIEIMKEFDFILKSNHLEQRVFNTLKYSYIFSVPMCLSVVNNILSGII